MLPARRLASLATLLLLPLSLRAAGVDFGREVLPILSDACFRCHGPDEGKRKAGLRLDEKAGLYRTRDAITVVKPGAPNESELVFRILSHDEEEVMPPRDAVRQLTPAEIALLKRWVEEGAKWSAHWSFSPIVQPEARASGGSPIDGFVRGRLAAEKLHPAPEADRERLLRRVSLDLTGLPPTPAETDAFLADTLPGAYERVVDRLLASPRYGERMAADWLDVARFADTHGYQMDRPRAMWAWRDWVIRAYNENLRFDEFATWQLAGDLLPNPNREQRLATAFNRLHNQNEEGGIVEEEYRVAYVADRVATFGTAFLGLTLDCCRCHDHKFDPVTQRDYYSLFAFFQNIDEAGQISYKGFADSMPAPTLLLTTPAQEAQLESLRRQTVAAEVAFTQERTHARAAFAVWLANKGAAPAAPAGLVAAFPLDAINGKQVRNAVDANRPGKVIESPLIAEYPGGPAATLDGDNGFAFPGVAHFKRTDAFSIGLWMQAPETPSARSVVLHHSKAPADAGSRGYEILLEQGRVAFGLHYLWPGASLKIATKAALPAGQWAHVAVTYDGSSRAAGARIYVNGRPAEVEVVRDGLYKDITYEKEPDLTLGQRFRDSGFRGGRVRDLRVFAVELTPLEVAETAGQPDFAAAWHLAPEQLSGEQREGLFDYFAARVDARTHRAWQSLQQLREAQNAIVTPLDEAMVMQELPRPKAAFVLQRGAYDARGEQVSADTPAALPPMPGQAPRNRLGLARWLTSPDHPLMARVTVNRLWQQMFGRGIVETSDNFGLQGSPPTHPELLDWLARDFIDHGWDVKRTLRAIACSATYRQSSAAAAELLARDPQNLLLARGPSRRLSAEMMRDQALAASGLLVEKLGGPSVKPYQPPGLWEEIGMGKPHYDLGTGDDLHRRSLYTFWKRTVPPPTMILFDAAERNTCTVRRQNTSTPLQALALLNDPQFVEAARVLGERMLREGGGTLEAQLAWAFRRTTGRRGDPRELAILREIFDEQREAFAADTTGAGRLIQGAEGEIGSARPAAERAASVVVAQALLNFDEAIMSR